MEQPHESPMQQCYAQEQLSSLQTKILRLAQALVVQRARAEKARQQDQSAARDAYAELQKVRQSLAESIGAAQFLLLELDEPRLALTAGQLQAGLLRFDLMSTAYKPVFDALCRFADGFPVGSKANAAVIGRLMNHVKMGYYPTDPDNIAAMLRGIQFPQGVITNLLDPCCGCGQALRQLAQGNNCFTYGVELDEHRAQQAQSRLHRVGFGSFFHSRISHEAFHLLFLNPPYCSIFVHPLREQILNLCKTARRLSRLKS